MKYFICFLVFLSFVFALFIWQRQKRFLKFSFLKNFFLKTYAPKTTRTHLSLLEGEICTVAAVAVLKAPFKIKHHIFKSLKKSNLQPLTDYLKTNEAPIDALLQALLKEKKHIVIPKTKAFTQTSKLALGILSEAQFERQSIIRPTPFADKNLQNIRRLLYARFLFFKTDLKKASEILIKLIKAYAKENNVLMTAYVYFMLGQIYTLAKAFDPAHLMFEKALKIYTRIHHEYGKNLILTAIGANLLAQNHFEEAASYFKKPKHFHTRNKNKLALAEILGFESYTHFHQNDLEKAIQKANKAFHDYHLLKNRAGMAFCLELQAGILCSVKKFDQAKLHLKSALKHYRLLQNRASELKMLCMLTQIELEDKKIANARKVLATCLKHKKQYNLTCYDEELENLKQNLNSKKALPK